MSRAPAWVADTAIAVVFAVSCVLELRLRFEDGPFLGPFGWNVALDLAFCATLALRRTRVRTTFVLMCAVYLLPRLFVPHASLFFGNFLPFLLVVYTVARYADRSWARWSWTGAVVCWVGFVLHAGSHLHLVADPVLPVGLGLLVWLLGRMMARSAEQRQRLADALDRLAAEQAEREQAAVGLERARVAGDMHDVVGGALSLMVVQIGNVRLALENDGVVRAALRDAEAGGRRALLELRRSLGVLRSTPVTFAPGVVDPTELPVTPSTPPTRGQLRWDALVALFFAGLAAYEALTGLIDDGNVVGPPWRNAVLGVLACLPLAVRRLSPRTAYLVMLAVLCLPGLLLGESQYVYGTLLPLCLAGYTISRREDGWWARLSWVSGALLVGSAWHNPEGFTIANLVFSTIFTGAAWFAGRTLRRYDVQGVRLRQTLDALAAERVAREETAVAQERQRIAAEMHDVVAHAVSTMVVQVGATRMDEHDPQREQQLRQAESTGRQALAELRQTLGVLRGDDDADLRPLPGLDAITGLVADLSAAGLVVDTHVESGLRLPEGVELTAYRIVQEALTNALKHGGEGQTRVSLSMVGEEVRIRVASPLGAGRGLPSGGHGIAGMRQRAALYDGRLAAGARDDRFVVDAVLRTATLDAVALA